MRRIAISTLLLLLAISVGCNQSTRPKVMPKSSSGVSKAEVKIKTDPTTGLTVEQDNVVNRLKMDNLPGSVKHLYIISPYSGQVLVYSTIKGKVTSSGKRLSPYAVAATDGEFVDSDFNGIPVKLGGRNHRTSEVLQDDGTYGSSVPYIFWWDAQGRYHQHFFTGGQMIHISDQPLSVKGVVINMELTNAEAEINR